jgi:hypothetical protein
MRKLTISTLAAVMLFAWSSSLAWSDGWRHGRHHHHFWGGVGLGLAIGIPLLLYERHYYRPPPEVVYYPAPAAPYYPAPPSVRYYCPDSRAYYPDVPNCDSEWLQVLPGHPRGPAY